MPIEQIRDPLLMLKALNAYSYSPETPPELHEKLTMIPGVDADRITAAREILYAHYDLLDDGGRTVLAQLADYAVYQQWSAENADGRCEKIRDAVRRDLGDAGDWGDPVDDPAPRTALREDGVDWRPRPPEEDQPAQPVPQVDGVA